MRLPTFTSTPSDCTFLTQTLNDSGAADVSVSRGPNDGGVSGTGSLFAIVFQAVGRGNTNVAVSNLALGASTGQPLQSNTPPALTVNVR